MKRGTLLLLAVFAAAGSLAVWLIVASTSDEGGRKTGGRGTGVGRQDPANGEPGTGTGTGTGTNAGGAGTGTGTRTEKTWRLTGKVRDPAGRAIEGAVVRSIGLSNDAEGAAFTDAEGEYGLDLAEPSVALDVYAEGYLPLAGVTNGASNRRFDFFAGQADGCTFVLPIKMEDPVNIDEELSTGKPFVGGNNHEKNFPSLVLHNQIIQVPKLVFFRINMVAEHLLG